MPNYKELYFELFSKITDIIEQLSEIQLKAEEKFISNENYTEETNS